MTIATLVLLALSAAVSLLPAWPRLPGPFGLARWSGAATSVALLAAATSVALLAAAAATGAVTEPARGFAAGATYVVTVLAAVTGGSAVVTAVFRLARRGDGPEPAAAGPLHGGRTIGVLERTAVATSILTGWPEGIAIVLAVKGLARYPELRASGESASEAATSEASTTHAASSASEQFIIGTFTSVMWAVAVCGVGHGLLS